MTIYNTMQAVVANIAAPDEATAQRLLREALTRAGFDVMDDGSSDYGNAFEAEAGTQPGGLPGQSPSGAHQSRARANPYW